MKISTLLFLFIGCALIYPNVAKAQYRFITTIAGNRISGFSGDDGPATSAALRGPAALATDVSGNLYIADYGNCRIRKVEVATGIITTIAGASNAHIYSGDGGPATDAELCNPNGIALDAFGNIYFSDMCNNRIRMINTSTGIITTVAGDGTVGYSGDNVPATSTGLYYPAGLAFDAAGDLYIADWKSNRVRKVTLSTGIITTVVGTGAAGYSGNGGLATAAELYIPSSVAFDLVGNMYVSEYGNSTVRKVAATSGIITTIAGNGYVGYSGDGKSSTAAKLEMPLNVITDSVGNIYIGDWKNYVVRMVSASTGIITTIAGNGVNGFGGDHGPATAAKISEVDGITLDRYGNLYISDENNNVVRKVECATCYSNAVAITNQSDGTEVYPNPTTNTLTITSSEKITSLTIANLVDQTENTQQCNTSEVHIDVSNLPSGIYLVRINGTKVRKFVKQ